MASIQRMVSPRIGRVTYRAPSIGMSQNVLAMHLVVQGVEPKARLSLRFGMERRLQLLNTQAELPGYPISRSSLLVALISN